MNGADYFDISPEFTRDPLLETDMLPNALEQLQRWVSEAVSLPEIFPTAMHLATSTFEGKPSLRVVFLKRLDKGGLYFFSNYESRKGKQLLQNPYGAAEFFWPKLERQVRIEGAIVRADEALSDKYFAKRSLLSKISAWASPQSQSVPNRKYLDTLSMDFREEFADKTVPRPANWGGYCLTPQLVEFWQGRPGRMHDRLQYILFNGEWTIERLAP